MPAIRKSFIREALTSFKDLTRVLEQMTEEEVLAALALESASQRRQSFVDRLISRAVRLNELSYNRQLKEKFHGTPLQQDPHPRRKEDR